ncbi:AraC family transcriptional regulator [Acidithiobacillus marinus]|uniref:AraC family transcriptional regulator n=1 Tax=Acidithiobacillus marinus TaxID=187490 RepID=A0A2I1DQC3_9PROT|nr:AraC family transcriptional regulator [Acidithiobacillus marinus]PKY12078.1 AraC family transcriptional regulator [Acidithiobacillus marinus]
MDPLSDMLSLLRPRSYASRGLNVAGRWALDFPPGPGIKCYALTTGRCWLWVEGVDPPLALTAGDCVLLPRDCAFRFGSDAEAPAQDVMDLISGIQMGAVVTLNGGGDCSGVGGYFEFVDPQAKILLGLLPPVIQVREESDRVALQQSIERLMQELREPQPGSDLLANHLAQVLLIQALRLFLAHHSGQETGWLFAMADRHIGAALVALHADPGRHWNLLTLAKHVGMSRSNFAARFKNIVGDTPMEYLTRWRMLLAADRLARGHESVSVIACALGYESESAFNVAFKRVMGCPPGRYARERSTDLSLVTRFHP